MLVILAAIAHQSCASDDYIESEPPINTGNGIHYKGAFHHLNRALINEKDANICSSGAGLYIRLLILNPKWSGINLFSFSYVATHVVPSTITHCS